jgi:protein TonB
VPPVYPRNAIEQRVQGVVILEAVISPTGCIRSVEVQRGVPALNWEAIRAVMRWRYTPTLLNGVPVPVIMTVTVNFKLS